MRFLETVRSIRKIETFEINQGISVKINVVKLNEPTKFIK